MKVLVTKNGKVVVKKENKIVRIREELSDILGRHIASVFRLGRLAETNEVLYGINNSNGKLIQVAVYSPSEEEFLGIL